MTQPHIEPTRISLIKENHNGKSDKDFVKLKMSWDPTSSTSDLYEFKMYLFQNGKPERFLLFISNFNKSIAESVMLEAGAELQYLCDIVRG